MLGATALALLRELYQQLCWSHRIGLVTRAVSTAMLEPLHWPCYESCINSYAGGHCIGLATRAVSTAMPGATALALLESCINSHAGATALALPASTGTTTAHTVYDLDNDGISTSWVTKRRARCTPYPLSDTSAHRGRRQLRHEVIGMQPTQEALSGQFRQQSPSALPGLNRGDPQGM